MVRVTKLCEFGIHVSVGDDANGLIHISELSKKQVQHPSEIVQVDDIVNAIVLRVDLDKRQIGLSIRRVPTDVESLGD